ncbi:MAG: SPOR domain-containing protein [Balneolaceae bacterium]|nr:SPOR domain-containing protein [Balneolaceae bacterium]
MKIDKKKLIQLLVEKTGMDEGEVEDQLQQLIDRIIDAAERGKALEIKEFGLFYFDEDGNLKFDPSKELSTEINFKYAGMEPVELKPPRGAAEMKESEGDEGASDLASGDDTDDESDIEQPVTKTRTAEEEEDLSAIFGFDEDDDKGEETEEESDEFELPWGDQSGEEEPRKQAHSESKSEDDDEYDDEEAPEREEDPFAGLLGDASSKMSATERGFSGDEEKPGHPLISGSGSESGSEKPKSPAQKKEKKPSKPKQESEPAPKSKPAPAPAAASETGSNPEKAASTTPPKKEGTQKKPEPAKPAAAATPRRTTPGYPGRQQSKRKDPIVIVIGIVLVFIIVAAAFLVIPGMLGDSETESQSPASTTTPSEVTEQPAMDEAMNMEEQMPVNSAEDESGSSGEPVSESETQEDLPPPEPETEVAVTDNVTADPVAEELEADNGYGLRGELSEEANDGYSIVLHSLRQEANAESIAADLDAEGYRVLVTRRTVNGQNVWRVSVGQFETIANAQEAALTLPSPYNSNNFIQRIPTN